MGIFPINKGRGQSATLPLKPPSYAYNNCAIRVSGYQGLTPPDCAIIIA